MRAKTIPYSFVSSQYPVLLMYIIGDDDDFLSEGTCPAPPPRLKVFFI